MKRKPRPEATHCRSAEIAAANTIWQECYGVGSGCLMSGGGTCIGHWKAYIEPVPGTAGNLKRYRLCQWECNDGYIITSHGWDWNPEPVEDEWILYTGSFDDCLAEARSYGWND